MHVRDEGVECEKPEGGAAGAHRQERSDAGCTHVRHDGGTASHERRIRFVERHDLGPRGSKRQGWEPAQA